MKTKTSNLKLDVKRSSAGFGLFAGEPIKKGARIIEYVGEKVSAAEANRRGGKYLFEINEKWTIDGTTRKNTARYVNHACGAAANCEAENDRGRIFILAKKNIDPGEELTYDYGEEYFDEHIKPHGCRCAGCAQKAALTRDAK